MELGLKRGHTVSASLIRARLVSSYSHSAVLIGDRIYHSTLLGGGVRSDEATDAVLGEYVWYKVTVPNDYGIGRYEEREGNGYDLFSQLAFILPGKYSDATRDYCFELTLHMLGGKVTGRVTAETILEHMINANILLGQP
jgi:hypothetical protein